MVKHENSPGAEVCPTRSYMACQRWTRSSLFGQSMKRGRCGGPVTDRQPLTTPAYSVIV